MSTVPLGGMTMEEMPAPGGIPLRRHDDTQRRSGDLIDSRAMLAMTAFLMNRPTCDQVAERLVLGMLPGVPVRGALITQFSPDGALHLVGSFGLAPPDLERSRHGSLWDRTPMADAVRAGTPRVLTSRASIAAEYPWLAELGAEAVAVWPLTLPDERVGALELLLDEGVDADSLLIDVSGLSAVLALYLSLILAPAHPSVTAGARPAIPAPASPVPRIPDQDHLTDRQLEVVRLMARGMTNPQIAHRIGFSESTVRQESMAIYRFLAVAGRREAVDVARSRGLLPNPE